MIAVHKELGPGLVEKPYRRAVEIEFAQQGMAFETEKEI
jgi:GxxExxY protein